MRAKTSITASALVLLSVLISPGDAAATTQEDFLVRNAEDLIRLCSTPKDDPLYVPAIHFCTGYLVGAYQYHESVNSGPGAQPLVCPPNNPKPTRNQAIADFIAWAKAHSEYHKDRAVDVMFRYMVEKWPCEKRTGAPD